MAAKSRVFKESGLERANEELLKALQDCREQLERAEKMLRTKQDNQPK